MEDNKNITIPSNEFLGEMMRVKGSYIEQLPKVSKEKYFSYAFGEDDSYPFMKNVAAIKKAVGNNFKTNFKVKIYPYAGHFINPPYTETTFRTVQRFEFNKFDNDLSVIHHWGGSPKGTVAMQEDVWKNIQKFFNYHIKNCSSWYQGRLNRIAYQKS